MALLLLIGFAASAHAAGSFTISTYKTFSPGEKPKIHLYARNVDTLEFRIYHVKDPEKFVEGLPEMHSFGEATPTGTAENIDEETWLEKFHYWKRELWSDFRHFLRSQLSHETREALQVKQAGMAKRSRVVGVAEFAQIPLLNDKQLVARWKQEMPPTFVSDNQILPVDPLSPGMYLVEATDAHLKAYTVLLVSETALVTRTARGQMLAFAVDRVTGNPIAGAKVSLGMLAAPVQHATTGADGIAQFEPTASSRKPANTADQQEGEDENSADSKLWVMARVGDDVALVAPWYTSFRSESAATYTSYAYTDRPVYRPGDTMHWRSILRQFQGNALVVPKLSQVHVKIAGPDAKAILDKDVPLSAMGTLSGDVTLPANAALGEYALSVTVSTSQDQWDTSTGSTHFSVEEYRKPEYQVHVTAAKPRVLQGESNQLTVDTRYFFGEPVVNAKVKYKVYQSVHYWYSDEDGGDEGGSSYPAGASSGCDENDPCRFYGGNEEEEQTGRTDANGKLTVTIPTKFVPEQAFDKDYTVEASVTDDAGRDISGRARFVATYGSYRISIEPTSYLAQKGQKSSFQVTAVDYDGKPIVQAKVHVHLYQTRWTRDDGQIKTDAGDADAVTGADGKATIETNIGQSGSIEVVATSTTPENRTVRDTTWLWAGSADHSDENAGETGDVQIIADKKNYAPGDIAHLSVTSSISDFHALVTASGYGVEFRKVVASNGKTMTVDLPITTDSQPNLNVEVVFLKGDKLYQGSRQLNVPPAHQRLQVLITPAASIFQPQQAATYDVTTLDYAGHPVSAELSFGVVDEAIYWLYPDQSGDMIKHLYPDRQSYSSVDSSIAYYFSGQAGDKSPLLAERRARYRPQLAQVKPDANVVQPHVRKQFPDTAFWQSNVRTDASGHARVTLSFPDSLTTWRATVRAITADSQAGSMMNKVIVRKNVIVRMGQPRFMRKGDVVSIPVIVHNYLPETKSIQLSLETAGVDVISGSPQQVTVPAKGEAKAIWKLRASQTGTATLTAKALSTQESDALQIQIPIMPVGVKKSVRGGGTISGSGERTLAMSFPANSDAAAHALTVEVSPTMAGTLFSALDYLTTFPYGCTEQTMSSFLPNLIVQQAAQQLHLQDRVDKTMLNTKIQAGLQRLKDYQHDDGGWGWWKEDQSQVFMTAYVVSGLAQATRAGYDNTMLNGGKGFLHKMLDEHPRMLPELRAYVVYALAEAGDSQSSQLDTLYKRRDDLSAQGLALTGLTMERAQDSRAAEISQLLEKKTRQDNGQASWGGGERNNLLDVDHDASVETTAFALKFLTVANPHSPLLPMAAQWLMAHRDAGYWWSSTEQTAFAIFGLTDYLVASKELSSELDAEVFVNGVSTGKQHFSIADAVSGATLKVTLSASQLQQQNSVRIVTQSSGRAYYSAMGTYYSTDKHDYQQGSMSLYIARDYFKLVPGHSATGTIVYNLQPLRGAVEQGDVLAVHIAVGGTKQRYLMIEDPIPAGTEFMSDEEGYNIANRPLGWDWWYMRREFHDDRATIFAEDFEKRHESFYLLKVVNPGSFEISPASVQPMYQPDVQATSDELHLDVKDVQ